MPSWVWCVVPGVLALGGCAVLKDLAVEQTAAVLADAHLAFDKETDPELAREAFPASLKALEGLLEAQPRQRTLLRLLAEATSSYAFGFLEDEAEVRDAGGDAEGAAALRRRAVALHLRGRDYGLRLLALDLPQLAEALRQGNEPPPEELDAAWSQQHLEALFWVADPWGLAIGAGRDQPELAAQVGIVRALARRCAELDETYYWGGPHVLLGAIDAAVPAALGGDPAAAGEHFARAVELSGKKHLMIEVMYARLVAPQSNDRALFERLLQEVVGQSPDVEPRLALVNRLAQRRARRYLGQADDLFL